MKSGGELAGGLILMVLILVLLWLFRSQLGLPA